MASEVALVAKNDSKDDESPSNSTTASSSSMASAAEKRAERMKRLKELHLRRNEARKMNHQEVAEEDRKNKLPPNFEARQRRIDW